MKKVISLVLSFALVFLSICFIGSIDARAITTDEWVINFGDTQSNVVLCRPFSDHNDDTGQDTYYLEIGSKFSDKSAYIWEAPYSGYFAIEARAPKGVILIFLAIC